MASDRVQKKVPELAERGEISDYLGRYAFWQRTVVLTPPSIHLWRLVAGEASRFPELAQILYVRGPQREIASFAKVLEQLAARDLLTIDDPKTAASHFNQRVTSAPLKRAMLLGDDAIPKHAALRCRAAECVWVLLAAYGNKAIGAAPGGR